MDSTDEINKLTRELFRERALRKALMELVPYAVVTATADYGLHIENSRAEQMLSRMSPTTGDSRSYQVVDGAGNPLPLADWPIYRAIKTGEPIYNCVVNVIDTNGSSLYQHVNVVPVLDEQNNVFASLALFLDNEVAEKYRLADILQSFQDCVISLDNTETIMYMNGHAEQLLNLSSADVVGKKLYDVFLGVERSPFMHHYGRAKATGTTVRFDNWSDILGRWMRVAIHPSSDRITVTFNDDTERKNYLSLIEDDANRTLKLLDDLLEWSKVQTGTMPFHPQRQKLLPIIDYVLTNLDSAIYLKQLKLSYAIPDDFEIFADTKMLTTIFQNLISNAIKYSNPHGIITISAYSLNNQSEIIIADTGIWMSIETKNKLFLINHQVSTPGTANEKGSGLGLILCKDFIEKHNGKIWVESELGKGSKFIFSLPNSISTLTLLQIVFIFLELNRAMWLMWSK